MSIYTIHDVTESDAGSYSVARVVCRTSDGTLWAFYGRTVSSVRHIFVSKSIDGGATWGSETQLSTGGSSTAWCYYTGCVVDSNDNVHVIYTQDDGTGNYYWEQLFYTYWNGSIWNVPVQLTSGAYYNFVPALGIDSSDNLHLVWYTTETAYAIRYLRKPFGSSWDPAIDLRQESGDLNRRPSLFIDKNDYIHVVWMGKWTGDSYYQIRYIKSIDGGTNWSAISTLTSATNDQQMASITCDNANGYPRIAWYNSTSPSEIYFMKWNGATWDAAVCLTPTPTYNELMASIAVDTTDKITVVWKSFDGVYWRIKGITSSDNGSTWGTASYLTPQESYEPYYPILLNGRWPIDGTARVNIPSVGYTFVWVNYAAPGSLFKICVSSDLAWETPATYGNAKGEFFPIF